MKRSIEEKCQIEKTILNVLKSPRRQKKKLVPKYETVVLDPTVQHLNYRLALGGEISYYPDLLSSDADVLFAFFHPSNEHSVFLWEKKYYQMYGKKVLSPRLMTAMKAPNYQALLTPDQYRDDDEWVKIGIPWPEEVLEMKEKLEVMTGYQFAYCWMNYYRDEDDYISWHTDSELCEDDIIVSVTLGAGRRFCLRRFRDKRGNIVKSGPPEYEITLRHGSVLVFDHLAGNKLYKHQVPKVRKMDGYHNGYEPLTGRINLTFRVK